MNLYSFHRNGKEIARGTKKELAEILNLTEETIQRYSGIEQRRYYEQNARGSAVYKIDESGESKD